MGIGHPKCINTTLKPHPAHRNSDKDRWIGRPNRWLQEWVGMISVSNTVQTGKFGRGKGKGSRNEHWARRVVVVVQGAASEE